MLRNIILTNRYLDSATLMLITNKMRTRLNLNSQDLAIMMGTPMNQHLLESTGLLNHKGRQAKPGDILLAARSEIEEPNLLALFEEILAQKAKPKSTSQTEAQTVEEALKLAPSSNLAIVSVPGAYAAREAMKLLKGNKNVLLFSDNVSIEDEVHLKEYAVAHDLLMMGPDCGTAIVHGVGLGFSNRVRRGRIGIVAASGTGLQEVASLIHNAGAGISQAFGTGSRDIQDRVGGIMMKYALDLLAHDNNTDVIVIVSKPPEPDVLKSLIEKTQSIHKPLIACFLGVTEDSLAGSNLQYAPTLADAARLAIKMQPNTQWFDFNVEKAISLLPAKDEGGFIRGLYCGGTLAYEALLMMQDAHLTVSSNLAKDPTLHLSPSDALKGHAILDMGDDAYTMGRPHPMIDPSERSERLRAQAHDMTVKVVFADVELGYGVADDAADILIDDIAYLRQTRPDLALIVTVCGSHDDPQGYDTKREALIKAGALVTPTHADAVRVALAYLTQQ